MAGSARSGTRVTIYDVAQRAGVSKSLVSLVLQGSAQVSPARREAVERAIDELGYRPSRAAATLAGQRSNTIGVVIDDFANSWFVELLVGLREGLEGSRFHVSVADGDLNLHLRETPVQGFLAARVDGLVLAGEPSASDVHGVGVPAVVAGERGREVAGADVIAADEVAGARMAVEHLLGLGHRRIGFVEGPSGPAVQRGVGYRTAMAEAGLEPVVAMAEDTSERGGHGACAAMLAAHAGLTAVVAANDVMAVGAWQAVREAGGTVPGTVSLVGYDDAPIASLGLIRLTTVDGRGVEVGRLAARTLRARIEDPSRPPVRLEVRPRLVVRDSTQRVDNVMTKH